MERHFYTYIYFDKDLPIYVGKGKDKRAWSHLKFKSRLGNLLRKRSKCGVLIEPMLTYHATEQDAFCEEIRLIALYGREDNNTGTLFNLTDGGEGLAGLVCTEVARINRTKAIKGKCGRKKGSRLTPETKLKISNSAKNRLPVSQETKDKLSTALTGKKRSVESIRKQKESSKNKPWSAARREAQNKRITKNG